MESLGQITVDGLDRQVADLPGQSLAQHSELFDVAWASTDALCVVKGVGKNGHGVGAPVGEVLSPEEGSFDTPPNMPYNPAMPTSTPSSIVYGTLRSALTWVLFREHRILRPVFLAALTTALWLNRLGIVCTLLVLGQVGEAIKEVSRGRTP